MYILRIIYFTYYYFRILLDFLFFKLRIWHLYAFESFAKIKWWRWFFFKRSNRSSIIQLIFLQLESKNFKLFDIITLWFTTCTHEVNYESQSCDFLLGAAKWKVKPFAWIYPSRDRIIFISARQWDKWDLNERLKTTRDGKWKRSPDNLYSNDSPALIQHIMTDILLGVKMREIPMITAR